MSVGLIGVRFYQIDVLTHASYAVNLKRVAQAGGLHVTHRDGRKSVGLDTVCARMVEESDGSLTKRKERRREKAREGRE